VLELNVLPGIGQDASKLTYSWNATQMTTGDINIQVYFDNPEIVSMAQTPDKLQLKFNDPLLFLGTNGKVIEANSRVITKALIPQSANGFDAALASATNSAKSIAQAVLVSNLVLNIFLSAALNQMWSMIETQQLIVLLLLFNIRTPANATAFFTQLLAIASFDFFNVEPATDWILRLQPTGALTDRLDQFGMNSVYFFNNLGSFGIIFLLYLAVLMCLPCLKWRCCRRVRCVRHNRKEFKQRLVWGYLIDTIRESCAIIAICGFINTKAFKWVLVGDYVHNVIALSFLALIVVFPLYSIWWVRYNIGQGAQQNKRMEKRFGSWYEGLDLRKGKWVLLWPAFYVLRRIHLAWACIYMDHFIYQTFMFILQVIFSIIFVGQIRPWEDPHQWKAQLVNEVILLIVYYHLMCFTPFFPDYTK
jgi:hypothetical protein